ncbi:hypothetical protein JB92DRAFT_755803 [Gautieria morchelliformis]|nr:hypothetical protein JB92DRAFT_755803 [Gautieria morchelliformis]
MYMKTIHGAWREENSAGSPNFGGYRQNPSIKMAVPTPMHIMVRMQLLHASPTPSRSRSSYRRSPSQPFGSNLATDDLLKKNVTPNVYSNELDIYSCEIRYGNSDDDSDLPFHGQRCPREMNH